MSTRVPGSPRRRPRQARSRATVAVIIEAGARILGAAGWEGFTTNRVAEAAGVSIGSLYQYFPDKTALLTAIRERHLADCLAALEGARSSGLRGEPLARLLVDGMIGVHVATPGLHRVLLEEVPHGGGRLDPQGAYEQAYLEHFAAVLVRLVESSGDDDLMSRAVIVSDALDGVIHNAVRRGTIGAPALADALARLIVVLAGATSHGERYL